MYESFRTLSPARRVPRRSDHELSKWELFKALAGHGAESCITIGGMACILVSVAREDGSGSSFNLVVHREGQDHQVYCRTKD